MTPETLQEVVDKKLDVESPEYDNHVFVRFKNGQYAVYDAATGVKPENQAKYCLELIGKDELFASLREEMDFTNKNNTTTYVLIKAIIKKLADA